MIENLVIEILVYRVSPEAYAAESDKLLNRSIPPNQADQYDIEFWNSVSKDFLLEWQERLTWRYYQSFMGRAWKYNDVVGFIGLFAGKYTIKAEYWFVDAKRIRRDLKKKMFSYRDKLFEVRINQNDETEEIRERISAELINLKSHFRLKKRYIDLEAFDNISTMIDWRALTIEGDW